MTVITGKPAYMIFLLLGALGLILMGALLVVWHVEPVFVLMLALGGIALVALSLRPYYGAQAFVMMMFFENAIPSSQGLTLMKALGVIIISSWLLSMAMRRELGFRLEPLTILMGLFLAWCSMSLLYAFDSSISAGALFTFTQLVLATLMFSTVVDTPARMRGIYWAFVLWAGLSTLIAIDMYYAGMTRMAVGLLHNRNLLAGYINVAIVTAYLLLLSTPQRLGKAVLMVLLPTFFLGLALTLSRTALVTLPITLLFVWYRVVKQRSMLILLGSLFTIVAITLVLPESFWKRAESIGPAIQNQEDTFGTRVGLWKIGLRMVQDHPMTGVGAANFIVAYPRYAHVGVNTKALVTHNTYVGVAAEMGLVGLTLFLLLHILSLRAAGLAVRVGRLEGLSDLEILGVTTEVCLISWMLGGLSGNGEGMKILWMLFGLCLSLRHLVRRGRVAETPIDVSRTVDPPTEGGLTQWTKVPSGL